MPSQKILEKKKQGVSSLVGDFKEAVSFVFVDARGLTVLEDTEMRADLRKNNVKYQVIKNTTSKFVFDNLGIQGLEEVFKGPTAIAYSTEDVIVSAKVLYDYAKKYEKLEIKSGVLDGKVISANEVNALAKIPGKDVLYTQIAYGLNGPITKLAMLLDALRVKLEEGGEAAPAAEAPAVEAVAEPVAEVVAEPVAETVAEPVVEAVAEEAPVAEAPAEEAPAVEEAVAEPVAEETPAE